MKTIVCLDMKKNVEPQIDEFRIYKIMKDLTKHTNLDIVALIIK